MMWENLTFNIWAVLVCAASQMVIGMIWYSPLLFGGIWKKLVKRSDTAISRMQVNAPMVLAIIPSVITSFGLAVVVGLIHPETVIDALIIGSFTALVFDGMSSLNLVFFEDRSKRLTLLNVGYSFVAFNVSAVILTLWR